MWSLDNMRSRTKRRRQTSTQRQRGATVRPLLVVRPHPVGDPSPRQRPAWKSDGTRGQCTGGDRQKARRGGPWQPGGSAPGERSLANERGPRPRLPRPKQGGGDPCQSDLGPKAPQGNLQPVNLRGEGTPAKATWHPERSRESRAAAQGWGTPQAFRAPAWPLPEPPEGSFLALRAAVPLDSGALREAVSWRSPRRLLAIQGPPGGSFLALSAAASCDSGGSGRQFPGLWRRNYRF